MNYSDVGIDLGTASVLVYIRGKGVVLKEPSVVAFDRDTNKIKAIGEEFEIPEFTTPLLNATYDDCHSLAMTSSSILAMDAYYAVSEDGLDIFVAIKSDMIGENETPKEFRDTFYRFQKSFNIYPKIAFESYTKLKGYGFKPHDDFALAKIGEARVMAGYTERGNITRLLIFGDDER